jgi:hypothetical protein
MGQGGKVGEHDGGDKVMRDWNGQEHSKMDTSGTNRPRNADRHERPQKRSQVTKQRPSPRRAPQQQHQAREGESSHPDRRIAGRLGNHVMHY